MSSNLTVSAKLCLLSSYTGTPKNLPLSTNARTGQEELGYRGFKRHSEHLLCIASSIGRALVSKTRGWEFEALAVRQVSTDWWRSWLAHMPVTHGVAGSSPVQSANVLKMREWWNGIHRRLKISRRKACGFESRLSHQ